MRVQEVKIKNEFDEIKPLTPYHDLSRCNVIEWSFQGTQYHFAADTSKQQIFIPILSKSSEEIILFLRNYSAYPPPCNVIILNGDATIRYHLCAPEPISDAYKKHEEKVGRDNAFKSRFFIQPDFYESSGNILCILIGFNYDWYEVRELNLKTGEFGSCRRSARL